MSLARYQELRAKVDAFFQRVQGRHAADLQCRAGCSDCCHQRLTVTAVEAAAIREEVAGPIELTEDPNRCAALADDGRCRIYAARPLVCRSHGLPIRMPDARGLPVIQNCYKNFTATQPDDDCVLDQTTLSTMLAAVEAEFGGGRRVELAELLRTLHR